MAFASDHSNVLVSSAPFLTSNTQVDVFALYIYTHIIYIYIHTCTTYTVPWWHQPWQTPHHFHSPHTWQKLLKSRMACSWDARGACNTISTNLSMINFWILSIYQFLSHSFLMPMLQTDGQTDRQTVDIDDAQLVRLCVHQKYQFSTSIFGWFPVTCCTIWVFSISNLSLGLPRGAWSPDWDVSTTFAAWCSWRHPSVPGPNSPGTNPKSDRTTWPYRGPYTWWWMKLQADVWKKWMKPVETLMHHVAARHAFDGFWRLFVCWFDILFRDTFLFWNRKPKFNFHWPAHWSA